MDDKLRHVILKAGIGRALLALSIPITLGNLLQTGYQLTDAFWVGRLGASAVAAVAISTPVTFLVIALGSGLAMAGSVLIALYAGAGRQDKVDHVAGQTMMMVLLTSLVLGVAGYLLVPGILALLRVPQEVRIGALSFMRVSFVGVVFVFIYLMFQALMRGVGQTRLPLFIVFAAVLLNFALDPLFVYGWGPLPGTGVVGAAEATVVTQGLAAALGIGIFIRGRHGIHLKWEDLHPDLSYLRKAFMLGLPASIDLSTRTLGLVTMTYLVAGFGTLPTAVYGVGLTIMQVVTIPAAGLSMALSTLVGQNLGADQSERAEKIARLGIFYGFAALSMLGIAAFAEAPTLVAFFVPSDRDLTVAAAGFLRIMALTWGGTGIQLCIVGVFRASGHMICAMLIAILSQWVVQFPLAYVLSTNSYLHVDGIWWSFPVSNVITAALTLTWFVKGKWKSGPLTNEIIVTPGSRLTLPTGTTSN
jgi:putative MATE family efflux protein